MGLDTVTVKLNFMNVARARRWFRSQRRERWFNEAWVLAGFGAFDHPSDETDHRARTWVFARHVLTDGGGRSLPRRKVMGGILDRHQRPQRHAGMEFQKRRYPIRPFASMRTL